MKKFVSTFIVLYGVWLLLAGFAVSEMVLGGIVALVLSGIMSQYTAYKFSWSFPIQALKFIFIYCPIFIYKLILSNLQVASIVLNPKLPIKPGFVRVRTSLDSDVAKLTLANSITLTPGTLALDWEGDEILVHCVRVDPDNKAKISLDFEKVLGGIFK